MKKVITSLSLISSVLFGSCDIFNPGSIESAEDASKIKEKFVKAVADKEILGLEITGKDALSDDYNGGTIYYYAGEQLMHSYFRVGTNHEALSEPKEFSFSKEKIINGKKFPIYTKLQKASAFPIEKMAAGIANAKEKLQAFAKENNEKLGEATCSQVRMLTTDGGIISEYRIETHEGSKTTGKRVNTSYYQFRVDVTPHGSTQITQQ